MQNEGYMKQKIIEEIIVDSRTKYENTTNIAIKSRLYQLFIKKKFEFDFIGKKDWYIDLDPFIEISNENNKTPDLVFYNLNKIFVVEIKHIEDTSKNTRKPKFFRQVWEYVEYYSRKYHEKTVTPVLITNSETIYNSGSIDNFGGIILVLNFKNCNDNFHSRFLSDILNS